MKRILPVCLTLLMLCSACITREPVTVGSKKFSENMILAEMFATLAQEAGIPTRRAIPYGNTFDLQKAIKEGKIDLYPEYTGTGLSMMGLPSMSDRDRAMSAVKDIFLRFDLQWLQRLGLDNSYVVVMRSDTAAKMNVETVSDLAEKAAKMRIGCEEEFMVRPVDGYPAFIRRYGFNPEPESVVVKSRVELYRKLVSEDIDVAITYRTDPQIMEFGLITIKDDLGFFPAYEAAPLIRQEVLKRYPGIEEVINKLAGLVDNKTMRELNRQVMLDGYSPKSVAENFLIKQGLYEQKPPELERRELQIAVLPSNHRSTILAQALDATRQVFPSRQIDVKFTDSPIQAIIQGDAFMALLGSENFYSVRTGELPQLKPNVEAIAPVGFRAVHLIKRDIRITPMPFGGIEQLGVGPKDGTSQQAAQILLDAYGVMDKVELVYGDPEAQAEQVLKGKLDGLLIMASVGDARMIRILDKTRLVLQPVSQWDNLDRQFRYPFFRKTRIAVDVYPGMKDPVDTIGSQVVLAGPRPEAAVLGDGDPVSGIRTQRQPIPIGVKNSLVTALGTTESIDPTLPGEQITVISARKEIQPLNPAPEVSVITAVFLLGLLIFFYRLARG